MNKKTIKLLKKNQHLIVGIILFLVFGAMFAIYLDVKSDINKQNQATSYLEKLRRETSHTDIDVHAAKILIDEKPELVIVDVSPNYDKGHIPKAINYYVGDGSLDAALNSGELDKNATYLIYCHFETASRLGAKKFLDSGYENVLRLNGEFAAWKAAGYTIEL